MALLVLDSDPDTRKNQDFLGMFFFANTLEDKYSIQVTLIYFWQWVRHARTMVRDGRRRGEEDAGRTGARP
jgi:hypothetical protein